MNVLSYALVILGITTSISSAIEVPSLWPRSDGKRWAADNASVALCLVGHYRTMFHPATIGAHLAAFDHLPNLERFAVLSVASDFHTKTEVDERVTSKESFQREHAAGLARYNLSSLLLLDNSQTFAAEFFRTGNCNPTNGSCVGLNREICEKRSCASGGKRQVPLCDKRYMHMRANTKESPENWAEQTYKYAQCVPIISEREKARGQKFDWIIKSRPDFVPMGRFPPLAMFWHTNPLRVYMSWLNDHWNLCPREMCERLLVEPSRKQLSCEAGSDLGSRQKAKLEFAGLGPDFITEMSVDYLIFRDRIHFNNAKQLIYIDCNFWRNVHTASCQKLAEIVEKSGPNATMTWVQQGDPEEYLKAAMRMVREVPPRPRRIPSDAILV